MGVKMPPKGTVPREAADGRTPRSHRGSRSQEGRGQDRWVWQDVSTPEVLLILF